MVTQLTATAENETVTLSFTPPTVGENGGYIDPGALTYQISRTPGGVLTDDFSGPLPYVDVVPELGSYTYTVTATFDGKSSDPVTSDRIVAGGMKELPYSESFDTESALDLFTIIDGNNDDRSWKYYESKQLMQFYGGYDADEDYERYAVAYAVFGYPFADEHYKHCARGIYNHEEHACYPGGSRIGHNAASAAAEHYEVDSVFARRDVNYNADSLSYCERYGYVTGYLSYLFASLFALARKALERGDAYR